jgi:hypothetical protein
MTDSTWRTKAFAVGGLAGALLGLGAAYIYVSAAEKTGERPELPASEAVGIGLALLAVLRQIATMYEKDVQAKKQLK